jgi:Rhodopirellula transposase DDE domain
MALNIHISHKTASKLLHQMDFSLRSNKKSIAIGSNQSAQARADRDLQFNYIGERREQFEESGDSVISVDTKKKEMIGNFINFGRTGTTTQHW